MPRWGCARRLKWDSQQLTVSVHCQSLISCGQLLCGHTLSGEPGAKLVPAEEIESGCQATWNRKISEKDKFWAEEKKTEHTESYLMVVLEDTSKEVCVCSLKAQKVFSRYTQARDGNISRLQCEHTEKPPSVMYSFHAWQSARSSFSTGGTEGWNPSFIAVMNLNPRCSTCCPKVMVDIELLLSIGYENSFLNGTIGWRYAFSFRNLPPL